MKETEPTLRRVLANAQRDAERTGETVFVLNLDLLGRPLYVIRGYDERLLFSDCVVAIVDETGV